MFGKIRHVHFTGIGGIGMSGIAEILHTRGYTVTGSDKALNEVTARLSTLGIQIYEGHDAANIAGADLVVYTSAVAGKNPEVAEAIQRKIPVVKRAEMLAECMRGKYGIGISGTHGKTSTTSMVALTLIEGGFDPEVIVGGQLSAFDGSNARAGKGDYSIVEADEFDRSFLKLYPSIAVITSIDADHLDTYHDIEDIKDAFLEYAKRIPFYGFVAACADEPVVRELLPRIETRVITYGIGGSADVTAEDIQYNRFHSSFAARYFGGQLGRFELSVPGAHNVKNALAAITIAKELDCDMEAARRALSRFRGAYRRFEVKYDRELIVIDDYAHHPAETSATLAAIRGGWNNRVIAVFQPHLYTRTRDFYKEFARSFLAADIFVCTDVYPARETAIEGVSGRLITDSAAEAGHENAIYIQNKWDIPSYLQSIARDGDIIITMGAGDINKVGQAFVNKRESGL